MVSYLDLAVVLARLAAIAVGLLWWGRPAHLRAAFVIGRAAAGASPPA